jgi:hypothetical protein
MDWILAVVLTYYLGKGALWLWLFYSFLGGRPTPAAKAALGVIELLWLMWHNPAGLAYLCRYEIERRKP